jgi:hypothetical protein
MLKRCDVRVRTGSRRCGGGNGTEQGGKFLDQMIRCSSTIFAPWSEFNSFISVPLIANKHMAAAYSPRRNPLLYHWIKEELILPKDTAGQ